MQKAAFQWLIFLLPLLSFLAGQVQAQSTQASGGEAELDQLWKDSAYEAYFRLGDSLQAAPSPLSNTPSEKTWLMRMTYSANYSALADETIRYGNNLITYLEEQTGPRDTSLWVSAYSWVGQQFFAKGNFARAIAYFERGEALRSNPFSKNGAYYADQMGNAYYQLAAINSRAFPDQQDFSETDSARKYFGLSFQRYQKADSSKILMPLYNLALLEQQVGDPSRALELIDQITALANFSPSDNDIPNLLGATYQRMGEMEKAKDAFLEADSLATASGIAARIMLAQNNLGSIYTELKAYPQALRCLTKAQAMMDTTGIPFGWGEQVTLAENLAEIYSETNQLDKANEYLSKAALYKNRQLVENLEAAAENAQEFKQMEQERLENLEALQKSQERAIFLLKILVAALVLLLILGILAGLLNRKQVLQRHQIKEQEFEMIQQQQQHENQINLVVEESERKVLYEKNKAQDEMMERMGKELHDQVASTMTACKRSFENLFLALEPLSDDLTKRYKKTMNALSDGISSVRKISHDLANLSLDNGLSQALDHLVSEVNELEDGLTIDLSTFQLQQANLPDHIEHHVFRILKEALTNILKHAQARHASLQVILADDQLNISIEDDGKGFNPARVAQGLGMRNMRERVEELHGKISFDSRPGYGASIFIDIPINANHQTNE